MSFPEYLKERISEDYKNLIIQKLEEIKGQTEDLKNTISPSIFQANQSLRDTLQRELSRLQDALEAEMNTAQEKVSEQLNTTLQEYLSSWYHSDISPFQQQLEILISDIISNVPPPPKKKSADLESLQELMRKLDEGNTQSEILNIVLQHISGWVDRAVLFVVKGDVAAGWAGLGLGSDWDANRIRQIKVDLKKRNVLREAVNTGQAAYGSADQYPDNEELFALLGDLFPGAALAYPIMVRGKIAGILYADLLNDLAETPDVSNLLFVASRLAGFSIDLLAVKPKPVPGKEAPAPTAVATVPAAPTAAVAVATASAPAPAPVAVPAPAPAPPTAAIPVAKPAPAPVEEAKEETVGTVMMPPYKPVISEEDQKLHEDAKRFARLLVSEIKLYNEAQVSAGRESRDIYFRLKDDIERSRRMYTDRVPPHIQNQSNYFYEELVRTLASGDPSLLGM